jgi:TP901 family phage tail tape measure protein
MADFSELEIKIDTSKAKKAVSDLEKELTKTAKSTNKAATGFDGLSRSSNRATGPINQFNSSLNSLGGSVSKLTPQFISLKSAFAGVTVASVAAGAAISKSTNTYAEFETQLSKIGVISGASAGELQKVKEAAEELGATTSFSQTQVAESILTISRAGKTSSEAIALVKPAMDLALSGSIQMDEAAKSLTTTMSQFGLEVKDATRIADVFTSATNKSVQDMYEFNSAMTRGAGGAVASIGRTIEEASLMVGSLANVAVTGERAGTAIKNYAINLANLKNPTKEQADVLKKVQGGFESLNPITNDYISVIKALSDAQLELHEISALVGSEAATGFALVIDKGVDSIEALNDRMRAASSASETAMKMQGELTKSTTELSSAYEAFETSVGEAFAGLRIGAQEDLTEFLRGLAAAKKEIQSFANITEQILLGLSTVFDVITLNVEGLVDKISRIKALGRDTPSTQESPSEVIQKNTTQPSPAISDVKENIRLDEVDVKKTIGFLEGLIFDFENLFEDIFGKVEKASKDSIEESKKYFINTTKHIKEFLDESEQQFKKIKDVLNEHEQELLSSVAASGPNASRGINFIKNIDSPEKAIMELVLSNEKVQETIDKGFSIAFENFDKVIDPIADSVGAILDVVGPLQKIASTLSGFELIVGALEEVARAISSLSGGLISELNKAGQGLGGFLNGISGGGGLGGQLGDSVTGIFGGQTKAAQKEANKALKGEVNSFLGNFYSEILDDSEKRLNSIQSRFDSQISLIKDSEASQKVKDELKLATRQANAIALAMEGFFKAAEEMAKHAANTAGATSEAITKTRLEITKAQFKLADEIVKPSVEIIRTDGLDEHQIALRKINNYYKEQKEKLSDLNPIIRKNAIQILNQAKAIEKSELEAKKLSDEMEALADHMESVREATEKIRLIGVELSGIEREITGGLSAEIGSIMSALSEQSTQLIIEQREAFAQQAGVDSDTLLNLPFDQIDELIQNETKLTKLFGQLQDKQISDLIQSRVEAFESAFQPISDVLDDLGDQRELVQGVSVSSQALKNISDRFMEIADSALAANEAAGGFENTGLTDSDIRTSVFDAALKEIDDLRQQEIDRIDEFTKGVSESLDSLRFDNALEDLSPVEQSIASISKKYSDFIKSAEDSIAGLVLTSDQLVEISQQRSSEIQKALEKAFDPFFTDLNKLQKEIDDFGLPQASITIEDLQSKLSLLNSFGDEGLLDENSLRDRQNLMQEILNGAETLADVQKQADDSHIQALERMRSLSKSLTDQVNALFFSEFNVAAPEEIFAEAQRQFDTLRDAAFNAAASITEADNAAITEFQNFAESFLEASQNVFRSGQGHVDNFNLVTGSLTELADVVATTANESLVESANSTDGALTTIVATLDEVATDLDTKVNDALGTLMDISINFGGENITTDGGVPVYSTDFEIATDIQKFVNGSQVIGDSYHEAIAVETSLSATADFEIATDIQKFVNGSQVIGDSYHEAIAVETSLSATVNDQAVQFSGASGEIGVDISATANVETGFSQLEKVILFSGQIVQEAIYDTAVRNNIGDVQGLIGISMMVKALTNKTFESLETSLTDFLEVTTEEGSSLHQDIVNRIDELLPPLSESVSDITLSDINMTLTDGFSNLEDLLEDQSFYLSQIHHAQTDNGTSSSQFVIGVNSPNSRANLERLENFISRGDGGPIYGPSHAQGGVNINAEGGEFVIQKSAVQKLGLPFLESINNGVSQTPPNGIYQTGGLVAAPSFVGSDDRMMKVLAAKLDTLNQTLQEKDLSVQIDVDTEELIDAKISENNNRIRNNLNRSNFEAIARTV